MNEALLNANTSMQFKTAWHRNSRRQRLGPEQGRRRRDLEMDAAPALVYGLSVFPRTFSAAIALTHLTAREKTVFLQRRLVWKPTPFTARETSGAMHV